MMLVAVWAIRMSATDMGRARMIFAEHQMVFAVTGG